MDTLPVAVRAENVKGAARSFRVMKIISALSVTAVRVAVIVKDAHPAVTLSAKEISATSVTMV